MLNAQTQAVPFTKNTAIKSCLKNFQMRIFPMSKWSKVTVPLLSGTVFLSSENIS